MGSCNYLRIFGDTYWKCWISISAIISVFIAIVHMIGSEKLGFVSPLEIVLITFAANTVNCVIAAFFFVLHLKAKQY